MGVTARSSYPLALALAVVQLQCPALAASLTLQTAVDRALQHSPGVRGADAGIRAAEAGVRKAKLWPNPILTIEAENVVGAAPYADFDSGETTVAVEWPLELGGKRAARIGVAEAERNGESIAATAMRAEITLRATLAFIEAVASARRADAAAERLALADQALRASDLRVRAGKVSPIDAQRAQVLQAKASIDADSARRAQELAEANLARLTAQPSPLELMAPWFDAITEVTIEFSATDTLSRQASEARVAAAAARLVAAQRARVPDLTVIAGSRQFEATGDSAAVLAVSVPLPLFNRGGAEVARSRAELDRAEADRAVVLQETEQAIAVANAEVTSAQALALATNGPALIAAGEAARIARIGYAEGKFSQLDLIDAERSLAETRTAAIEALSAYHNARARLARLQGRIDPIEKD